MVAVQESRRLVDAMGWALILPLMLAMLGGVFVAAKTGQSIQNLVTMFVDPSSRLALIVIYCLGMALVYDGDGKCLCRISCDGSRDCLTVFNPAGIMLVQHH